MIAVCAGSFDPVTDGHVDVITRAAELFERVIALVAVNPAKVGRFAVPQRVAMLRERLSGLDGVVVDSWDGLLVDYCRQAGECVLVRGLRTGADVADELKLAMMNSAVGGVETVFLPTTVGLGHHSSTVLTEVAAHRAVEQP
ncbi:pantetheine-phosphate adenylyltransferase [Allokutzneria sp. NRRL B-24872]|uniref:pantetheine-phosphate adenylyltransferase n=1 Tax=Allokutzneria sp. NRRL B-24872 TaxID=1137961 RepID=UPI00143E06FB|nr:pantetheine-phosphate adenylyltransferase [Allokutzneria sp. NRRL B-24872]